MAEETDKKVANGTVRYGTVRGGECYKGKHETQQRYMKVRKVRKKILAGTEYSTGYV
jgi:hypothetical protein